MEFHTQSSKTNTIIDRHALKLFYVSLYRENQGNLGSHHVDSSAFCLYDNDTKLLFDKGLLRKNNPQAFKRLIIIDV